MGSTRLFAWGAAGAAAIVCAVPLGSALAAPPPAPAEPPITPYVERGMMYGPGQGGLGFTLRGNTAKVAGSSGDASIDLALGLSSRVTLDGSLGKLSLEDVVRYHEPRIGVWFGLVDTEPVELDLTAGAVFGTGFERPLRAVEPGAIAVFRLGGDARIDVATYLPLTMDGVRMVGLRVPAQLAVQLNHALHVAVTSGLAVDGFGGGHADVPLGLALGCTVPLGSGGYMMISPSLTWQKFLSVRDDRIDAIGPLSIGVSLGIVTPP